MFCFDAVVGSGGELPLFSLLPSVVTTLRETNMITNRYLNLELFFISK